MIDATTREGMARLILLLQYGTDCWRVVSFEVARRAYVDAAKQT